jgi:hypothetical protein
LEARECEFHPGQAWSLMQAVGVMGEVQLRAKLNDKQENDPQLTNGSERDILDRTINNLPCLRSGKTSLAYSMAAPLGSPPPITARFHLIVS